MNNNLNLAQNLQQKIKTIGNLQKWVKRVNPIYYLLECNKLLVRKAARLQNPLHISLSASVQLKLTYHLNKIQNFQNQHINCHHRQKNLRINKIWNLISLSCLKVIQRSTITSFLYTSKTFHFKTMKWNYFLIITQVLQAFSHHQGKIKKLMDHNISKKIDLKQLSRKKSLERKQESRLISVSFFRIKNPRSVLCIAFRIIYLDRTYQLKRGSMKWMMKR